MKTTSGRIYQTTSQGYKCNGRYSAEFRMKYFQGTGGYSLRMFWGGRENHSYSHYATLFLDGGNPDFPLTQPPTISFLGGDELDLPALENVWHTFRFEVWGASQNNLVEVYLDDVYIGTLKHNAGTSGAIYDQISFSHSSGDPNATTQLDWLKVVPIGPDTPIYPLWDVIEWCSLTDEVISVTESVTLGVV